MLISFSRCGPRCWLLPLLSTSCVDSIGFFLHFPKYYIMFEVKHDEHLQTTFPFPILKIDSFWSLSTISIWAGHTRYFLIARCSAETETTLRVWTNDVRCGRFGVWPPSLNFNSYAMHILSSGAVVSVRHTRLRQLRIIYFWQSNTVQADAVVIPLQSLAKVVQYAQKRMRNISVQL